MRERQPVVPRCLAYSMVNKCVSPRRDASFQQTCCFIEGNHNFSKQAFRLGHIHAFKFMRCFAMANLNTFSMHMLTRKDQWVTKNRG